MRRFRLHVEWDSDGTPGPEWRWIKLLGGAIIVGAIITVVVDRLT